MKNQYWNQDTDKAIKMFVNEADMDKRNILFEDAIFKPLRIIAEVAAAKYGLCLNREDIIQECISHMYLQLPKIDYNMCESGYSFITRCGFHYVMQKNIRSMNNENTHVSIDVPILDDGDTNILDLVPREHDNSIIPADFDFDKYQKILVEKITERDIDRILNRNARKYEIKYIIIRHLTNLGSVKFLNNPIVRKSRKIQRENDLFRVTVHSCKYMNLLAPLAKKLAKLD